MAAILIFLRYAKLNFRVKSKASQVNLNFNTGIFIQQPFLQESSWGSRLAKQKTVDSRVTDFLINYFTLT